MLKRSMNQLMNQSMNQSQWKSEIFDKHWNLQRAGNRETDTLYNRLSFNHSFQLFPFSLTVLPKLILLLASPDGRTKAALVEIVDQTIKPR